MKAEFYSKDTFQGSTMGMWRIRLDIPGVNWVKLANESSSPVLVDVSRPPSDYHPGVPPEVYDRSHCFRLCDRIGKLLCHQ